ncbi:MAG: hypothetical protein H0V29_09625 [Thermoleophilaceae bacterium]|nr:hypothetical protein [Thermoleophilaceae bacterium]
MDRVQRERFWTHRLRWRFKGAWVWPAFAAFTVADWLVLWRLPPTFLTGDPVWALFMAMFGNLVIVGAIAPFLAKRLDARDPDLKPYVVTLDRVAVWALVAGLAGCFAVGLGGRKVIVSETEATERAAELLQAEVAQGSDGELRRNLDAADTVRMGEDVFRTCLPKDDRSKGANCFVIDVSQKPGTIKRDPSPSTNRQLYPDGR